MELTLKSLVSEEIIQSVTQGQTQESKSVSMDITVLKIRLPNDHFLETPRHSITSGY